MRTKFSSNWNDSIRTYFAPVFRTTSIAEIERWPAVCVGWLARVSETTARGNVALRIFVRALCGGIRYGVMEQSTTIVLEQ